MQYGRRARLSGGDESGAVAVVAETRRMEVDGQVEREVQDVRSSGIGSAGLLGVLVASCMACAGLVFVASASAAGRLYWANSVGKISSASLEGGGSDLSTTGASVDNPLGVTIDSAAGLIFWANASDNKISYANLNGSGGGDLNTTGAVVNGPEAPAVDPATGLIYWANETGNSISFANLNNTGGGGNLVTTGAAVESPTGLAVDPATGLIYWASGKGNTISFANLNDTGGGGKLKTTGALVDEPIGVAVDPATGLIYWANFLDNKISFAELNDTGGGGNLNTTGAVVAEAEGVAVDPATGLIYWANTSDNKIFFASVSGGGGGELDTAGATAEGTNFPVLLQAPSATGAPVLSGGSVVGSALSCSQGDWAPDLLPAFDYIAPQSFAFDWSENGTPILGATSSSITAGSPGSYTCQVTASNQAGAAAQSSAAVTVTAAPQLPAIEPTIAPTPTLAGLSETAKTWREGKLLARISASESKAKKKPPVGTTFSFSLNEPASVTFTFTRPAGGRKVAKKCVAQSKNNKHKPHCTRTLTAGTLTFSAHAGATKVRFEGLLSKRNKLKPGSYTVLVTATASGKRSTTRTLHFTIADG